MRAGHADASLASAALSAAALRIQAVEAQMSLFRADSDLVRLNRLGRLDDAPVELLAVLRVALRIARESGGLFDPTVQPLWRLRHDAALAGRVADPDALLQARALLGWRDVRVDAQRRSIHFTRVGMALTLNGIAQGWATDAAAVTLKSHGIAHALIDAGEWQAMGRSPDGSPWRLGVQDPRAHERIATVLAADGRAIACSSDDKLAYDSQHKEHHILDPRSGHSPTQLASVVVLAPNCALADALTKPMMMGSASQAFVLAKRWGVDVITIDKAGRITASHKALLTAA
jgi:FAD:protein FMN transferase